MPDDAPCWTRIGTRGIDNVTRFQTSSLGRAAWQLINSFIPYVLLWVAMVFALSVSYWLMLPLAILAAGFLIRIFIIFHDCGHVSFFKSKRANNAVGIVAGLLNLTPYRHWRWQHALHHGTAGDLDRRGSGDIWTLTVQEYLHGTRWNRFAYRLARNPLILVSAFAGAAGLYGCSMFSISSKARIGRVPRIGITRTRRSRAARSTSCREFCSGSPAISGSTTSII